jgi:hypothetical protein
VFSLLLFLSFSVMAHAAFINAQTNTVPQPANHADPFKYVAYAMMMQATVHYTPNPDYMGTTLCSSTSEQFEWYGARAIGPGAGTRACCLVCASLELGIRHLWAT